MYRIANPRNPRKLSPSNILCYTVSSLCIHTYNSPHPHPHPHPHPTHTHTHTHSHSQTVQGAGCRQGTFPDHSRGYSGGQYQSNEESKGIYQTLYHDSPRCSNGNSSVRHCTLLLSSHHCSLCGMQGLSEQGNRGEGKLECIHNNKLLCLTTCIVLYMQLLYVYYQWWFNCGP